MGRRKVRAKRPANAGVAVVTIGTTGGAGVSVTVASDVVQRVFGEALGGEINALLLEAAQRMVQGR